MRKMILSLSLLLLLSGQGVEGANYLGTAGTSMVSCKAVDGWTNYGSNGTPTFALESTIYKTGSTSLKFDQANDGDRYVVARYKNLASALDLSATDGFAMWVYTPVKTSANNYLQVQFAVDSTFAKRVTVNLGTGAPQGFSRAGWNLYQWRKADMTAVGGFAWASDTVGTVMFKLATASTAATMYIDSIQYNVNARPKILLTMDDSDASQVDQIEYANTQGIPVTAYTVKLTTALNLAAWQALYAAGNDICPHGGDLTALTLAEAEDSVEAEIAHLIDSGMPRGTKYYAWGEGKYNSDLQAVLTGEGIVAASSIMAAAGGIQPSSYNYENHALGTADILALQRRSLDDLSLAQAQAAIDEAITDGTTLIFYAHTFGDEAGDTWTVGDWEDLCEYIKTKVDAGSVDAVTISQWYSGMNATAVALDTSNTAYSGDIEIWVDNIDLVNCTVHGIIWNYSASGFALVNCVASHETASQSLYTVSNMTTNKCLFRAAAASGIGTNTATATTWGTNPIFHDEAGGDLRPRGGSPCVCAGTNDTNDDGTADTITGTNGVVALPSCVTIGAYQGRLHVYPFGIRRWWCPE